MSFPVKVNKYKYINIPRYLTESLHPRVNMHLYEIYQIYQYQIYLFLDGRGVDFCDSEIYNS